MSLSMNPLLPFAGVNTLSSKLAIFHSSGAPISASTHAVPSTAEAKAAAEAAAEAAADAETEAAEPEAEAEAAAAEENDAVAEQRTPEEEVEEEQEEDDAVDVPSESKKEMEVLPIVNEAKD